MTYPAEQEPDGARFGPHHYLYPLYALLVACYVTQTYAPVLVGGIVLGLVGWFHFWKWYPKTGATLSGLGLLVAAAGVPDLAHTLPQTLLVLTALLWATDDWVSHALGKATPLDYIFDEYIAAHLP